MHGEDKGVGVSAYERETAWKNTVVCAPQELASVDSERAWHSTYHAAVIVYVCVCVWSSGLRVCLPLASVRNLPFSLLKAGETMGRSEVDARAGCDDVVKKGRVAKKWSEAFIHAALKNIHFPPPLPVVCPNAPVLLMSFGTPVFRVWDLAAL